MILKNTDFTKYYNTVNELDKMHPQNYTFNFFLGNNIKAFLTREKTIVQDVRESLLFLPLNLELIDKDYLKKFTKDELKELLDIFNDFESELIELNKKSEETKALQSLFSD